MESITPLMLSIDFDGEGPLPPYEVIDIFPNGQEKKIPVCFFPGYGHNATSYIDSMKLTAHDSERRVIAWTDSQGAELGDVRYDRERDVPHTQLSKVLGAVESLEYLGTEQVDVVAHSEGAIHAVLAATLYPEHFRNIVIVNPAGMIGESSMTSLMLDTIKEKIFRAGYRKDKPLLDSFKQDISLDKAGHMLDSFIAITKTQIHQMLAELRKNPDIRVSLVHTDQDQMFDFKDIESILKSGKNGEVSDYVDEYRLVPGDHGTIFHDLDQFKQEVLGALEGLEEKIE